MQSHSKKIQKFSFGVSKQSPKTKNKNIKKKASPLSFQVPKKNQPQNLQRGIRQKYFKKQFKNVHLFEKQNIKNPSKVYKNKNLVMHSINDKLKKNSSSSTNPLNRSSNIFYKEKQNASINAVMSILESSELTKETEKRNKKMKIEQAQQFKNARKKINKISFENFKWLDQGFRKKKGNKANLHKYNPSYNDSSNFETRKIHSYQNNYISPSSEMPSLERKYSHRIITKKVKKMNQGIAENKVVLQSPAKNVIAEPKMSSSKSQNNLLFQNSSISKNIKKSQSSSNINILKNNSSFSFSQNTQIPKISLFNPQKTSRVDILQKYNFSQKPREPQASRSRSRKINLADYKMTKIDKSTKSLKKFIFHDSSSRPIGGPQDLQSNFTSIQNNVIPPNPEKENSQKRSRFKTMHTPLNKKLYYTRHRKSPSNTNVFKHTSSPFKEVNKIGIRAIDFSDVETRNLKSDHLESSRSEVQRSFSTSKLYVSGQKSQNQNARPRKIRVISRFSDFSWDDPSRPQIKRSISTNTINPQKSSLFSSINQSKGISYK